MLLLSGLVNYLANYFNAFIVFSLKLIEKYYINNIFIIISQQILSGRLLLAVTNGEKSNFSGEYKL